MRKKTLKALAIGISLMMAVSACGSSEPEPVTTAQSESEAEAPVIKEEEKSSEDDGKEEEETEIEEEKPLLTYSEEKDLKFNDNYSVTINAIRRNPENQDDFDVIDSDWEISGITVEDSEDGKVITVEQRVSGYIWGNDDGSVFKTDISLPGGLFCDTYTGTIIPSTNMVEDMQTEYATEIEWNGKTYTIKREESAKWEDGEWEPNPEGEGHVLLSTLCITDILTVSNDYDGLALILSPLNEVGDSDLENAGVINEDEKFILDVLEDDGYLFSIAKAYESLNGISMADALNGVDKASTESKETAKESATEKEEKVSDTKQNASTVHQHNYTSAVTKEPCCGENGVKTFTCACGDSYTESIPALGHQWVAKTEVVNHPSQGHMETQTIEKVTLYCGCGAAFDNEADYDAHKDYYNNQALDNYEINDVDDIFAALATNEEHGNHHWDTTYETVNNWVVDSEAWDETVTYNVCSVCGAKQ